MNDGKYLNEETYQKNNAKVKRIGKILLMVGILTLVLGVIFIILGLLGFGNTAVNGIQSAEFGDLDNTRIAKGAFGSFGFFVLGGFLDFIGFVITVAGIIVTITGHRREITAYTTQQVMPVAQEGVEKMTPTFANAAGSIAQSISQGIQEGKNNAQNK